MSTTRPVVMEINTDNFKYNISKIQEYVGDDVKLMPILKANAYGTYINKNLDIINDFDIVAVANVDEAIDLRNVGYKKEIFVLNQPYKTEIKKIIDYNITIGLSSIEFLEELNKYDSNVVVHLEVESGMGRTGIKPDDISAFIDRISSNIKIEGIYTHLSSADNDFEYTSYQIGEFKKALDIVLNKVGKLKYIHAAASNGIINYPNAYFNLVRPGIIMHGYKSSDDTYEKIDLKPITTLKANITFLKTVDKGTSVSYGRTFITTKETKIATVPLGYADGIRRELSNNFEVLVNGKKAKIIGKVCMDSFMIDVTDIDVKVGDEVIIWDNTNITLDDIADVCNTINYEILCNIGSRVPRIFR